MSPKEKPILFSGPMVRAILQGRKTMTRRLVRWPKWCDPSTAEEDGDRFVAICKSTGCFSEIAPPYAPGDVLWVRETWRLPNGWDKTPGGEMSGECVDGTPMPVRYAADGYIRNGASIAHSEWGRLRPSIHMPRWASRVTLLVVEVRKPERLQDIGKDGRKAQDVLAEGITEGAISRERRWFHPDDSPAIAFKRVWDYIHGSGAWDRNDWVWPIQFEIARRHGALAE